MTNKFEALEHSELLSFINYNDILGVGTWNKLPRYLFASDWEYQVWNYKNFGKQIGKLSSTGYYFVNLPCYGTIAVHRLFWFYQTGEWPKGVIDHINHISYDNRWCNLRDVSQLDNCRNQAKSSNNTSGYTGVRKENNKWVARISIQRKTICLGQFSTIEEAVEARRLANIKYGFHENHGE